MSEVLDRTGAGEAVLYVHGKGGCAEECGHYGPLFPGCGVSGLDYRGNTPWEAGREIREAVGELGRGGGGVVLVANSIGAFFSLHAGLGGLVRRAYFISPVVDMEGLILGLMAREGVGEEKLRRRGEVATAGGETLSWEYLGFVRSHPVVWDVPTRILCGRRDGLVPLASVEAFARRHGASLTVAEHAGHWFHTEGDMRCLDDWIRAGEADPGFGKGDGRWTG